MKIKTQFIILIFAIALIPMVSTISLPLYHYFTSPQRYLLKGYKELRNINSTNLSDSELNQIHDIIKELPPNIQIAIYSDFTLLISNIPGLKAGSCITPAELFVFIGQSSNEYDYRLQGNYGMPHRSLTDHNFLVISRMPLAKKRDKSRNNYIFSAFIFVIMFETICIIMIISLSKTIFSSIQLLESNTQKIANGEFDTQIEIPKTKTESNEITSLNESLERMRVSLKDNQERRNKFIMGISHDLRTPVALIKGYSEAITDGVVSDMDSIKKSLSIVENKADQLEVMINDLINYMKLNTTEWRQHLAQVPIEPVLTDFASSASETADVYNRTIVTNVSVNKDVTIFMDKNLLTRALENLFSNALRYTRDGDSIFITAEQNEENIIISIEDTGIGMEEKDIAHIYDMFYRGTSSRREQGMGIGLSIVKTVIDSHGWSIDVQSEPNKGTIFFITIPLENKSNSQ